MDTNTATAEQIARLHELDMWGGKFERQQAKGKLTEEFVQMCIDAKLEAIAADEAFRDRRIAAAADLERRIREIQLDGGFSNRDLFTPTSCGCLDANGIDMCTSCGHSPA